MIIHIYEIMQCYYIVIVNLRGYSHGQTFLKCVQKAPVPRWMNNPAMRNY
ncbi:conserved hypothetical protein [Escherichia coli]|nr:conserved hypothetical protein [Escherichia coli]